MAPATVFCLVSYSVGWKDSDLDVCLALTTAYLSDLCLVEWTEVGKVVCLVDYLVFWRDDSMDGSLDVSRGDRSAHGSVCATASATDDRLVATTAFEKADATALCWARKMALRW